jgi:putative transposase
LAAPKPCDGKHRFRSATLPISSRAPPIGIHASAVNQIWHLDLTVIKLVDGIRVFIKSVVDNFSRFVLATHVSELYGGTETRALLDEALATARTFGHHNIPNVIVDGGSENDNYEVNELIISQSIHRTIAQLEVYFPNSIIEVFFRRLKNSWLCLQRPTSIEITWEMT